MIHYNSDPPIFDPLLNAKQVEERLSCSKPQVYLLIRRGILPAVRIETMVRIRNSDLELFIENNLIPAQNNSNEPYCKRVMLDFKDERGGK